MASFNRAPPKKWHEHINIDLVLKVASNTIFHPFVAWMVPLGQRGQALPWSDRPVIISTCYAAFLTLLFFAKLLSQRMAFGDRREADASEEVVVVTGGASGLGLCIAEIYGMRNASVAVIDIAEPVEGRDSKGVDFYKCDVGNKEQVTRVWKQITEDLGTPTVLINNAAILHGKRLLDMTSQEIDASFRINTLSHYYLSSLFLPPLLSRPEGGHLVTVSSVLGRLGAAKLSAYTATKAALIAFHNSISAELADSPAVKTILCTPGQLSTELFEGTESTWLQRFLGPTVDVKDVAMQIIKKIDAGEGGVVTEPAYARWVGLIDLLPYGMQKAVRDFSGLDTRMNGWTGKIKAQRSLSDASSEGESPAGEAFGVIEKTGEIVSDEDFTDGKAAEQGKGVRRRA